MQRLVTYAVGDLAYDPRAISARLNKICAGRTQYRMNGICQIEGDVYFVLLPQKHSEDPEEYIIVPLEDMSDAGVTSILEERWEAGFNVLGTVNLGEGNYVLVLRKPGKDD